MNSSALAPSIGNDAAAQAIIMELKRLILEDLQVPIAADKLAPHVPLLDGGMGLDSITFFELITLIEKRYEISFPAEILNSEAFANLAVVARQVQLMLDQNSAAESTP
jgi:acyl carrier protein